MRALAASVFFQRLLVSPRIPRGQQQRADYDNEEERNVKGRRRHP